MGSLNIPNVPPVAPAWPSADVVAQQSVSVTVLKPADGGVAAMAYIVGELGRALEHARRRHRLLDGVVELAAFRREFVLVLDEEQRRLGRVDGRAALRLGGREDAVGRDDGVRGPERGAARACVCPALQFDDGGWLGSVLVG